MDAIHADRHIEGANASTANRFPVRFVLFDNFRDCCDFIGDLQSAALVEPQRIDYWMEAEYPDIITTHSRLAQRIKTLVQSNPTKNFMITPLSELARFYDNEDPNYEFNALIKTIKEIETTDEGYRHKQRVYIPIIGLEGKMEHFQNDSQSFIYYFKSADQQLNYKLILTDNNLFGVQHLEEEGSKYSIAHNVKEWLTMWKYPELKQNIICISPNIFTHAHYAKPDNAFSFVPCTNARDFLVDGLDLDLDFIGYKASEEPFWCKLATEVDDNHFNFDRFFNERFQIHDLSDYSVFFRTWFDNRDAYSRWLLAAYYTKRFCNEGYICRVLQEIEDYSDVSFVSQLATSIFAMDCGETCIDERKAGLNAAEANGVVLPPEIQQFLVFKIREIANTHGYQTALRYVTTLTKEEKYLLIEWLSKSFITRDAIRDIYPDLYYYLDRTVGRAETWMLDYIDAYKQAKLCNTYTDKLCSTLNEHNRNELTFRQWYDKLPTVRSAIGNRSDIQVYFWIDGLGLDWTSFIAQLIRERNFDGYYLNEVFVARAKLPTRTDINKDELMALSGNLLDKKGDIDQLAHTYRKYPEYIVDDLDVVRKAINDVLNDNPGRKIAIVSDHGMTYMSQHCQGLNLSGYNSDHGGRIATKKGSTPIVEDANYIRLEDNKTICALKHASLQAKIGDGLGAHGGCTPEEVLVPILIISPDKNNRTWKATQLTFELDEANPIFEFELIDISSATIPTLIYNNHVYCVHRTNNGHFVSERLNLVEDATKIRICIGSDQQEFNVNVKLAAKMDDDLLSFD